MTSPNPSIINDDGTESGEVQNFSCKYSCAYCPDQPGSVRSYIRGGPTAERGFQNDYQPIPQNDYQRLIFYAPKRDAKVRFASNPFVTKNIRVSARMNFNKEVNNDIFIFTL